MMSAIYDAVQQFFQAEGWPVIPVNGEPVLEMKYHGQNGRWDCYAHAREDEKQLLFYSICPASAPPALRAAMAEYLERANWGLILGNFEMDWQDGEIRFKTCIVADGDGLSPVLIRQMVFANVLMMDKYLPGIMVVRYSSGSPAEAIAQVERPG